MTCVENIIPNKIEKAYPNIKPWLTKSLEVFLNIKRAFRGGDLTELKREVKLEKRAKQNYKEKIERDLWISLHKSL